MLVLYGDLSVAVVPQYFDIGLIKYMGVSVTTLIVRWNWLVTIIPYNKMRDPITPTIYTLTEQSYINFYKL